MSLRRIVDRIVDHVGAFGLVWAVIFAALTWFIWAKSPWPFSDRAWFTVMGWLASYVAVRAERRKNKCKDEAFAAIARLRVTAIKADGRVAEETLDTIERGLRQ